MFKKPSPTILKSSPTFTSIGVNPTGVMATPLIDKSCAVIVNVVDAISPSVPVAVIFLVPPTILGIFISAVNSPSLLLIMFWSILIKTLSIVKVTRSFLAKPFPRSRIKVPTLPLLIPRTNVPFWAMTPSTSRDGST